MGGRSRTIHARWPGGRARRRREYERNGIPRSHLRASEAEGRKTNLSDCAKAYVPNPNGRWGFVFQAVIADALLPILDHARDRDTFFSDVLHGYGNGLGCPCRIERLDEYTSGLLTLSQYVDEVAGATLA